MSIRGSIDLLTVEGANGWLYAPAEREPVIVQAHLFGRIIGETVANVHRPDLFVAGLGDGNCGFNLTFYQPIKAEHLPMVAIRPQGGDVELPRTNLTGFPDFFRAVQARHPAGNRSRSVFGGLWTDRGDAGRVLSGRLTAGTVAADLEGVLRAFVDGGFAVLRGAVAPLLIKDIALIAKAPAGEPLKATDGAAARRVLEAVPDALFRDEILPVCRAILDDNLTVCRTVVQRGGAESFAQPSTAEGLPSPTECLATVLVSGADTVEIDVVRGSHALPEFTADGRSRWIASDAAAAVEIALAHGASVDTITLTATDLAIIGPGTLHRLRTRGDAVAVCAWCIPSHHTPLSLMAAERVLMRHESGAALVA